MFKNYIKIAFRNIIRERGYSFINITGLAIGMTSCLLIFLWIFDELSFDHHNENFDRIYRVVREGRTCTPSPLGPKLMNDVPEVESASRFIKQDNVLMSHETQHYLENNIYWADPEIFDVFTISSTRGESKTALQDPFSLLISETMSEKYFKGEDPIGKMINVADKSDFTVAGVFKDIPGNSHIQMDFIIPYKTYFQTTGNDINHWFRNFSYTYFLLKEGVDPIIFENKFSEIADAFLINTLPPEALKGIPQPIPTIFFMQKISRIHLFSHLKQEIGSNGDIKYVYLFGSIALLILIIACINYINLATARASQRGKEVGIRKVAGAHRKQLINQFFGESIILTIISMAISVILLEFILPTFNQMSGRQIDFNPFSNPIFLTGLIFITIFVGLSAGFYPALNLSRFAPITVLKGNFTRSSKGQFLRNILVITQFTITISLIICTLIIRKQMDFVYSTDLGYNKEQVVVLPVRSKAIYQQIESVKSELKRSPDILEVSTAARLPNNIDTFTGAEWKGMNPDINFTISYNTVDENYIDLYDIEIVKGRNFSKDISSDNNGVFLINETAAKAAQFENPLNETFLHWNDKSGKVVGVMKDFHFKSLHHPIEPLYLFYDVKDFANISIKVNSENIPETISYIKNIINKFAPDYPFEYSFFDEEFGKVYQSEKQLVSIFSAFAVLAIIIACMGLFGLSLFSTERRVKEFGVRIVLGSSTTGIIFLVLKEFTKWIVISNVIAWPLAYFTMDKWLQYFAFRTNMGLGIFIISGTTAVIIALLTVSYQALKVTAQNPVKALKYE